VVEDAKLHQPAAGAVQITPGSPTTSETLIAGPSGFSDPDGDALSYQYQWKVNGVAIAGATGPTFALSQVGHGDAGDVITVVVSARDPQGHVSTDVSRSVTVAGPALTSDPAPTAPGSVVTPPSTPVLPVAIADKTAPKIVASSPQARSYKRGQTLKIKLAVTDASGSVTWKATVRRGSGKARTVKQGTKLHLTRTGSYVLRVTAKDRAGNVATKTVRFRAVRG
jgi:hypothetical protein